MAGKSDFAIYAENLNRIKNNIEYEEIVERIWRIGNKERNLIPLFLQLTRCYKLSLTFSKETKQIRLTKKLKK